MTALRWGMAAPRLSLPPSLCSPTEGAILPCELNLSFHSLTKCIRLFQASRKAYSKVCRSESLVESSVACAQSICIHLRRSLLFGLADE